MKWRYRCPYCGQAFKYAGSLATHKAFGGRCAAHKPMPGDKKEGR